MSKILFTLIHFTWCLPQTLVGLIYLLINKLQGKIHYIEKVGTHTFCYTTRECACVSLGNFIFINNYWWYDEYLKRHEVGHYKQSLMLGWLYLIVIAIPSMIWNKWGHNRALKKDPTVSYYSYWTEKWADKLVGNQ